MEWSRSGWFGAALPASSEQASPTASQTASASNESDDEEEQNCADCRIGDRCDHPGTEMDAKLRQQQSAYEGSCNADNHIADEAQASALHEMARQPSGDDADQKQREQSFT